MPAPATWGAPCHSARALSKARFPHVSTFLPALIARRCAAIVDPRQRAFAGRGRRAG
jgi:hypothetical protein